MSVLSIHLTQNLVFTISSLAADISPDGDKIVAFHSNVGFRVYNANSYVTIATFPVVSNPGLQPLVGFAHRGRAILGSVLRQSKLYRMNGETYSTFNMFSALLDQPRLSSTC